jgi:ferredoxin--NADP+ reductase
MHDYRKKIDWSAKAAHSSGMTTFDALLPAERIQAVESPPLKYKPASPLICTVLRNERLTPEDYSEDVRHIVIDLHNTDYVYCEGQSMGVIPPGTTAGGKAHRVRLYSIASPGAGEPGYERAVALCVKRVLFETEEERVHGVCSNHLCDLREGDSVSITGPNGKNFALPANDETDLLLFATGTGIAPFRAFLMNLYARPKQYGANVHLFFGSRLKIDHLYANHLNDDLLRYSQNGRFQIHSALSRENPSQKVYVGDLLRMKRELIEPILDRKNYAIYICGLKGMEKGIEAFIRDYLSRKSGQTVDDGEWARLKESLKRAGRWAQEVY